MTTPERMLAHRVRDASDACRAIEVESILEEEVSHPSRLADMGLDQLKGTVTNPKKSRASAD